MKPITWRKDGDTYYGDEPGEYVLGLGNTPEGKWFDGMHYRVDAGAHVSFLVPANPPYYIPTFTPAMDAVVLASLAAHVEAIKAAARDMAAEP